MEHSSLNHPLLPHSHRPRPASSSSHQLPANTTSTRLSSITGTTNLTSNIQLGSRCSPAPATMRNPRAPSPAATFEWEFHREFGVLHTKPCRVCKEYASHLLTSNDSLHQGSTPPTSAYNGIFMEGVKQAIQATSAYLEGIMKQLNEVKAERDRAVKLLNTAEKGRAELERRLREAESKERHAAQRVGPELSYNARMYSTAVDSILNANSNSPTGTLRSPDDRFESRSTAFLPQPPSTPKSSSVTSGAQRSPSTTLSSSSAWSKGPPSATTPSTQVVSSPSVSPTSPRFPNGTPRLAQSHGPPATDLALPKKTNPHLNDSDEVWYEYYSVHHVSWPRGVRMDSLRRPIMADLRADRAIARWRPPSLKGKKGSVSSSTSIPSPLTLEPGEMPPPTPRNQFKNVIVDLFLEVGLYAKLVRELGLKVAPVASTKVYDGSIPILREDVVRFLAKSGVTMRMAAEYFEPWAANYKAGINCSDEPGPGGSSKSRRKRSGSHY